MLKETKELKEALKKKLSLAQGETDGDNHTRKYDNQQTLSLMTRT